MLHTKGLVHFTIPVTDLDRSEKFYTEIMGFKKVRRNAHMVFMRSGADLFVLTHSETPVNPNPGDGKDIHTAFEVDGTEYDKSLDFLKSKGIKVLTDEERHKGTFHGRSAYFHDPDRNVLEIIHLINDPLADRGE
jgi:catechol 2,3-dioxygenase-like lactoylglutathione lyase family enzyme